MHIYLYIFSTIIFTLLIPELATSQIPYLEQTLESRGYKGDIKSIKHYTGWFDKDSVYVLDTILRFHNEYNGFIEYDTAGRRKYGVSFNGPPSRHRETYYTYNKYGKISTVERIGLHDDYYNITRYSYDYENKEIMKVDSLGFQTNVDHKMMKFHKTLYQFDSLGRTIITEYIDDRNATVKHTIYEYDSTSQLSHIKFYDYGKLDFESWYEYDELGNRKRIRSAPGMYGEESIGVYVWNGISEKRYTRRNEKDEFDVDNTEYYIYDEHGNKVKEYMINNLTGRQVEFEWEIEYYD